MTRLPKADAIVVLGCTSSARRTQRIEHAVRLFREGLAPVLLLSGGGRGPEPEAELMRRAAVARGVPDAALVIEPYSRDTLGKAGATPGLQRAHGWRKLVRVSVGTPLPRAAVLFRLAGVEVIGRSGVRSRSRLKEIGAAIREAIALPRSLLRALVSEREGRRRQSRRVR